MPAINGDVPPKEAFVKFMNFIQKQIQAKNELQTSTYRPIDSYSYRKSVNDNLEKMNNELSGMLTESFKGIDTICSKVKECLMDFNALDIIQTPSNQPTVENKIVDKKETEVDENLKYQQLSERYKKYKQKFLSDDPLYKMNKSNSIEIQEEPKKEQKPPPVEIEPNIIIEEKIETQLIDENNTIVEQNLDDGDKIDLEPILDIQENANIEIEDIQLDDLNKISSVSITLDPVPISKPKKTKLMKRIRRRSLEEYSQAVEKAVDKADFNSLQTIIENLAEQIDLLSYESMGNIKNADKEIKENEDGYFKLKIEEIEETKTEDNTGLDNLLGSTLAKVLATRTSIMNTHSKPKLNITEMNQRPAETNLHKSMLSEIEENEGDKLPKKRKFNRKILKAFMSEMDEKLESSSNESIKNVLKSDKQIQKSNVYAKYTDSLFFNEERNKIPSQHQQHRQRSRKTISIRSKTISNDSDSSNLEMHHWYTEKSNKSTMESIKSKCSTSLKGTPGPSKKSPKKYIEEDLFESLGLKLSKSDESLDWSKGSDVNIQSGSNSKLNAGDNGDQSSMPKTGSSSRSTNNVNSTNSKESRQEWSSSRNDWRLRRFDYLDILDDLTQKDLLPLRSEYPRKDNEITSEENLEQYKDIQNTYLWKMMYGKEKNDTIWNHLLQSTKMSVENPITSRLYEQQKDKRIIGDEKPKRIKSEKSSPDKSPVPVVDLSDKTFRAKKSKRKTIEKLAPYLFDPKKDSNNQSLIVLPVTIVYDDAPPVQIKHNVTNEPEIIPIVNRSNKIVKYAKLNEQQPLREIKSGRAKWSKSSDKKKQTPQLKKENMKNHQTPMSTFSSNNAPDQPQKLTPQQTAYKKAVMRNLDRLMKIKEKEKRDNWRVGKESKPTPKISSLDQPHYARPTIQSQNYFHKQIEERKNDEFVNNSPKKIQFDRKSHKSIESDAAFSDIKSNQQRKMLSRKYGKSYGDKLVSFIHNQPVAPELILDPNLGVNNNPMKSPIAIDPLSGRMIDPTDSLNEKNATRSGPKQIMMQLRGQKKKSAHIQNNLKHAINTIENNIIDILSGDNADINAFDAMEKEITSVLGMMKKKGYKEGDNLLGNNLENISIELINKLEKILEPDAIPPADVEEVPEKIPSPIVNQGKKKLSRRKSDEIVQGYTSVTTLFGEEKQRESRRINRPKVKMMKIGSNTDIIDASTVEATEEVFEHEFEEKEDIDRNLNLNEYDVWNTTEEIERLDKIIKESDDYVETLPRRQKAETSLETIDNIKDDNEEIMTEQYEYISSCIDAILSDDDKEGSKTNGDVSEQIEPFCMEFITDNDDHSSSLIYESSTDLVNYDPINLGEYDLVLPKDKQLTDDQRQWNEDQKQIIKDESHVTINEIVIKELDPDEDTFESISDKNDEDNVVGKGDEESEDEHLSPIIENEPNVLNYTPSEDDTNLKEVKEALNAFMDQYNWNSNEFNRVESHDKDANENSVPDEDNNAVIEPVCRDEVLTSLTEFEKEILPDSDDNMSDISDKVNEVIKKVEDIYSQLEESQVSTDDMKALIANRNLKVMENLTVEDDSKFKPTPSFCNVLNFLETLDGFDKEKVQEVHTARLYNIAYSYSIPDIVHKATIEYPLELNENNNCDEYKRKKKISFSVTKKNKSALALIRNNIKRSKTLQNEETVNSNKVEVSEDSYVSVEKSKSMLVSNGDNVHEDVEKSKDTDDEVLVHRNCNIIFLKSVYAFMYLLVFTALSMEYRCY